jgi:hypothetical protein
MIRSKYLPAGIAVLGALLLPGMSVSAENDPATYEARISELEAKVQRLEALIEHQTRVFDESCARVDEVEEAVASCARVEEVEEALADAVDSPTLYDETDIRVGGYVKMDAILSDYSNAPTIGAGDDFFIPSTIATFGESGDPRLNLHAKETRFWLKSFTPTEQGDVSTHFEIDFLAGQQGNERVGNSFSPRIRHASLHWDRWTFGQTWTNFFNTSALPDYLDFIGPVGVTFARQAQIRYTVPVANGDWAISLENPETTLTPFGGGLRIDADDSSLPDLVLRRNWKGSWGNLSVAALLRELKIDEAGLRDSQAGAAISLAGKFLVRNRDDFRWQLNYGNALGRYMGINAFNAGALTADGTIELTPQYGALAAYRHFWNDRLHSSFGASFASADNDTDISGLSVPKAYQSAHADIIWSPIERLSFGAEYIYGRREDESGDDGMLNRLQLSAKYVY